MSVLPRPTAPTHELPGAAFTSLATPSVGGSADTAVWEVRLAPGHAPTPHQLTRHEVFVIISGSGTATLADSDLELAAGDTLVVPPQTRFAIQASGEDDLVALCCLAVGGQAVIDDAEAFTPPWAL
jgi:mannose-6-phosphate isomerase-like protein (cupin superfamily)